MQHKIELDELNKQKLEKIEEYIRTKKIGLEQKEKLEDAHNSWQQAWAKYMDVLVYLETLEI